MTSGPELEVYILFAHGQFRESAMASRQSAQQLQRSNTTGEISGREAKSKSQSKLNMMVARSRPEPERSVYRIELPFRDASGVTGHSARGFRSTTRATLDYPLSLKCSSCSKSVIFHYCEPPGQFGDTPMCA